MSRVQFAASAKQAGGAGRRGGDEAAAKNGIMKDLIQKNRSKGSLDAQNRWWVAELLAEDCEKAWTHTGWEDTMQKWYERLEHMMQKDEKGKMEEMHQRKVEK